LHQRNRNAQILHGEIAYASPTFDRVRLTLPNEDAAEHRRLYDEWMAAYPCRGPIERGFAEQAVVALLDKRRIERVRTTVRTERVRTAVLDFERWQEDEVARCVDLFNESCAYGLRHLLRSAAGCRWAIAEWEKLEKKETIAGLPGQISEQIVHGVRITW